MKYLVVAPSLTEPTLETIREQSTKVFAKIEKLLKKFGEDSCVVKISVIRDGNYYKINVELMNNKLYKPFIAFKDADLRRAIGMAAIKMKAHLLNLHNRRK